MNNFTFGNERHQYYETIAGGSGAGPDHDGTERGADPHDQQPADRSRNPGDALPGAARAVRDPPRLGRRGRASGAATASIRDIRFLEPMRANILANRRRVAPQGHRRAAAMRRPGRNWVERADGSIEESDARPHRRRCRRATASSSRRRAAAASGARRMINYWPLLGIALVVLGFALQAQSDAGRHRCRDRHRAARRDGPGRGHLDLRQGVQRQPHHRHRLDRPAGDRPARALRPAAARRGGDPQASRTRPPGGC